MQPSLPDSEPAKSAMDSALEAAFGRAAPLHFAWQTAGAFVAERERELVSRAFLPLGARVLDLGCGEGATLFHLGEPEGAHGVNLFPDKVSFAQQRLPKCHFRCASVYELPFENASFNHLLVRDVVHHLEEPDSFVNECRRVLAGGGRIDVLEPCRYNPMIFLHAVSNKAERGELRSTCRSSAACCRGTSTSCSAIASSRCPSTGSCSTRDSASRPSPKARRSAPSLPVPSAWQVGFCRARCGHTCTCAVSR